MPDNILTNLNWLDLLMIVVMIGTVYRGAAQGFIVEFFRILGTFFAIIFALHFYFRASEFIYHFFPVSVKFCEIVSFILIAVITVLVFKLARDGWILLLKVESKSSFSKWLGAILGVFHSFLVCALLFFFISLLAVEKIDIFAQKSITGVYLRDLSLKVYKATYDEVISKFFPDEPRNIKASKTINNEVGFKK